MKTVLFLVALTAFAALPAHAQLGPAGVPGAPGLAPAPAPAPAPARQDGKSAAAAKIPAVCAKAKNVEQCVARQELRRKARTACKDKAGDEFTQCVNDYMKRKKK